MRKSLTVPRPPGQDPCEQCPNDDQANVPRLGKAQETVMEHPGDNDKRECGWPERRAAFAKTGANLSVV
jgi:hypothetical protein